VHPADMIFFWANANPDHLAIIQPDMAVTYREFASAIAAVAERLKSIEFDDNEPVAVAVDNPMKQLAICYALLRSGCTPCLAAPGTLPFLKQNGINNVIHAGEGQVLAGGRNITFHDSWLRLDTKAAISWNPSAPSSAAEIDVIFFTSGTTGVPKKTFVPGAALMEWTKLLPVIGHANRERVLVVPGLSSAMGYNHSSLLFYAGKTACFARSPKNQLALINTFAVEELILSPQQLVGLLDLLESGIHYHVDSLKEVRAGGGYLSPEIVRRTKMRLCRNVTTQYGATETGLMAFANFDVIADVPNAVGFVIPGMQVEIVDDNDKPLDAGEQGRVRFRSSYYSMVFAANNPDDTVQAANAWWYPGDLGILTANGILCIMGRVDDVINYGGHKVLAAAIDDAITAHPSVEDGAVCGVRGASGLDEVWVAVVPRPDFDPTHLVRFLQEEHNFGVRFARVIVVDKLPRNNLGKLQRQQLKELMLGKAGPEAR
jgi:acyl-coenzyme A synthetase/AMP-(fatty) acid ligase